MEKIETPEQILEHVSAAIGAGFFEFVIEDLRQCRANGMSMTDSIVYAFERTEHALVDDQVKSVALSVCLNLLSYSDFDPKELRKLVKEKSGNEYAE